MKALLNKNDGMTIAEVMISLAAASGLMLSIMACYVFVNGYANEMSRVTSRDDIQQMLRQMSLNRIALKKTIENNPQLASCFKGGGSGSLPCKFGTVYGLTIYDVGGEPIAGDESQISTTVFYDETGKKCVPSAGVQPANCPISATATFRAQGLPRWCSGCKTPLPLPVVAGSSERPELIEFRYTVSVANQPNKMALNDWDGSIVFALDELNKTQLGIE